MVFDPAQSKTFEPLPGAEFNITYGDQSFANGPVGTDTVDIGGATVTRQAIGVPTQVSQSFIQDTSSNGLVGLAFSNINTVRPQQQETFFANVAPSLDLPVMTAALRADGGIYEFGRIDAAKFTGQMVNVSVDPANGFWQFESAQFAVGNGPLQPIQTTQTAIADTGTTLMLSSPEVVQAYYAQVQGAVLASAAGGYIYPCAAQLPDLSVAVGSQNLATIPGSMISFSKIGMNTTTGQPGQCPASLSSLPAGCRADRVAVVAGGSLLWRAAVEPRQRPADLWRRLPAVDVCRFRPTRAFSGACVSSVVESRPVQRHVCSHITRQSSWWMQ